MDETEYDDEGKSQVNTCTLKFYKKRNRTPAFITEFMNGQVGASGVNTLRFECFKSTDNTRCLNANNGRLNYTGSSSNYRSVPLQYFVGVRDKKTGKMKLYDSSFFRMKPKLDFNKKPNSADGQSTPKEYRESINELTANFGSKVKKRALNSILKNTVSVSPLDGAMPLDIASVSTTPEISTTPAAIMDYLPPINREASIVCDVFDIRSIISPQEDEALDRELTSLFNAPEELAKKRSTFNSFVSARFIENNDFTKAKYLLFYNYLVEFQHLGYMDIRRKEPATSIPEPFRSKFLNSFTVESSTANNRISRSIPPKCKDKLAAYILALALIIDDFNVNTVAVGNDLKNVGLSKLVTIAQALGCHISTTSKDGNKSKIAVLKLPLYVLTVKRAKKPSSK